MSYGAFTQKTINLTLKRDDYSCVCCGTPVWAVPFDIQHRLARGMGGTSNPLVKSPVNALTMLRRCHRRVEDYLDPADGPKGYRLEMGQDPALTPVTYWNGRTAWLTSQGGLVYEAPAGAEGAA